MTFKQIYNQLKDITIDDTPIDRTKWIDLGVKQFEDYMNRAAYEEVITQATSKALIYKLNHKRGMSKKQKTKMVIELMIEHGLIEPDQLAIKEPTT